MRGDYEVAKDLAEDLGIAVPEPKGKESAADRAIRYVLEHGVQLFHDQHGEPFIAYRDGDDRREVWPLNSKATNGFIRWQFYLKESKGLNGEALATARATLAAQAQFLGEQLSLSVRVARLDGQIYYDLGNWRAVQISSTGWQVIDHPPILFRHYAHQDPQVQPILGGSIDAFFDLINVRNYHSRLLLKVYLVAALIPDIPLPVLLLHGEHGSAKSILLRFLRAMLDPSGLQVLAPPENLREFVQLAAHHRCVYLDNLSSLPAWLSDALCRLCTGEGLSKRVLFTDDDDMVYNFRGLGAISGVNLVVTKPDLLDRAIILRLEPIPEKNRRTEAELWQRFENIRPFLLGAIFDVLSEAICLHPQILLDRLPRLADFGRWGAAIAQALGNSTEEFVDAYGGNVATQNEAALEESVVAQAVIGILQPGNTWEGTASRLLQELESNAERLCVNTKAKAWPKSPNSLARRLREVCPNLRRVGVEVSERKTGGIRLWSISRQQRDFIDLTAPIDPNQAELDREDETTISTLEHSTSTLSHQQSALFQGDPSLIGVDRVGEVDISPISGGMGDSDAAARRRLTL